MALRLGVQAGRPTVSNHTHITALTLADVQEEKDYCGCYEFPGYFNQCIDANAIVHTHTIDVFEIIISLLYSYIVTGA